MHCMTVSLADGGMRPTKAIWEKADRADDARAEASFTSVTTAHLETDFVDSYIIASKT